MSYRLRITFMLRLLAIIFLFLCIVFLSFYAGLKGPEQEITSWEALSDPKRYEGYEIESSYNRVIGGLDQYIVIGPFGHKVNLKVDSDLKIRPYDFISYKGVVRDEGYIEVNELYVHLNRRLKYLASLIPAVVVSIWFLKRYRFDFRKFYFEKR